jgi:hypothetical protein
LALALRGEMDARLLEATDLTPPTGVTEKAFAPDTAAAKQAMAAVN